MMIDYCDVTKIAENDEYATYEFFFGPNHPGQPQRAQSVEGTIGVNPVAESFNRNHLA